MKTVLAVIIAVVAGVMLGAYLSRPAPVRAQAGNTVYVTHIKGPGKHPTVTVRGEVIGFSCTTALRDFPECFVLSR